VALGHVGQQVAGEVDPAPLVGCSLEAASQGLDQPGVLVGDDQLHPGQSALLQRGEEAAPECLVLPDFWAVPDVEAEDLTGAGGGDPGRHDHRHRDHLGGVVAHVQVGRVEVDVGKLDVLQGPVAERRHDLVQSGADP